jgi:membrane protein DedA with SNARE-associated domain
LQETINSIETYGYILLFLYSLGGGFVGLVAAGVLSFLGKLSLTTSIIVAFSANFLGDMLLFYISRNNKEMFMPYLNKQRRVYAMSHLLIKKYGDSIVFIQKFIYGVKTLVPIAMALSKYSSFRFNILNLFAAALWAIVVGLGSYYASDVFLDVFGYISDNPYIMPVLLITIIGGAYMYLKRASRKKP